MVHRPHDRDAALIAYVAMLAIAALDRKFWDDVHVTNIGAALIQCYPSMDASQAESTVRKAREAVADDLALPPWEA